MPRLLKVKTKVVLPNQQAPLITGEIGIQVQSMLQYFNSYYLTSELIAASVDLYPGSFLSFDSRVSFTCKDFHLLKFELFIVDVDVDIVHDKMALVA